MTWMLTRHGNVVDLDLVDPESISILDIAHSLSIINRFAGHTSRPYSVAEHSLLVHDIIARDFELDPFARMAALLHDAHEAYTTDLIQPMKQILGNAWAHTEMRIQLSVLKRFGLITAYTMHRQAIKTADMTALATERRDLLPDHPGAWECLAGFDPHPMVSLGTHLPWEFYRERFLDVYGALEKEIADIRATRHQEEVRS